MTIAMAHSGRNAGSTVAEINLKFLSKFIDPEQIGKDNDAYVVGPSGRLLAHSEPDSPPGHRLRRASAGGRTVHGRRSRSRSGRTPTDARC